MLVKKKNQDWFPSEAKDLKVGDTIEITDAKSLILNGDVVGLAADGITEVSAYELYGVIVADEKKEFEDYLRQKKAEAQAAALKAEEEKLAKEKAELEATKAAETKVEAEKLAKEKADLAEALKKVEEVK